MLAPEITHTKRLTLQVLTEEKKEDVLALYNRNRRSFEAFEPTRPQDFYTPEFHRSMLAREYSMYQRGQFLRYYIFPADETEPVIGAVNFYFHNDGEPYAEIGYKVDHNYTGQGIAYEACAAAIDVLTSCYIFRRIDARIHPDNIPSLHVAGKLGFSEVAFEPKSANILGKDVDLFRYRLRLS